MRRSSGLPVQPGSANRRSRRDGCTCGAAHGDAGQLAGQLRPRARRPAAAWPPGPRPGAGQSRPGSSGAACRWPRRPAAGQAAPRRHRPRRTWSDRCRRSLSAEPRPRGAFFHWSLVTNPALTWFCGHSAPAGESARLGCGEPGPRRPRRRARGRGGRDGCPAQHDQRRFCDAGATEVGHVTHDLHRLRQRQTVEKLAKSGPYCIQTRPNGPRCVRPGQVAPPGQTHPL